MPDRKTITAENMDVMWSQLANDFSDISALHNYHVVLQSGKYVISVDMVSSPGGGFEGGYGSTNLRTTVIIANDFEFVIYPEDFLNKIGKLFGMQDVVLGYGDLDDSVIIKTNDAVKLKSVLADAPVRNVLSDTSGYMLKLENEKESSTCYLEMSIQRAVMDFTEFQNILNAYIQVLGLL